MTYVNSQNSYTVFHNAPNEPLWQTLHRRRQDHKITLFYKMFNQLTPVYLSSLIPQQVNAISHHNLWNSNDIHTIRSNTSLYHNSFLPSTLRQWNSLPVEVRQLNTLSSFKTFLKKDLQSVPTYFTVVPGKPKSFTHVYVQAAVL